MLLRNLFQKGNRELAFNVLRSLDIKDIAEIRLVSKTFNEILEFFFGRELDLVRGGSIRGKDIGNLAYTGFGMIWILNREDEACVINSHLIQANIFINPHPEMVYKNGEDVEENKIRSFVCTSGSLERSTTSMSAPIFETFLIKGNTSMRIYERHEDYGYRYGFKNPNFDNTHDKLSSISVSGPICTSQKFSYAGPLIKCIDQTLGIRVSICPSDELVTMIVCCCLSKYKFVCPFIFVYSGLEIKGSIIRRKPMFSRERCCDVRRTKLETCPLPIGNYRQGNAMNWTSFLKIMTKLNSEDNKEPFHLMEMVTGKRKVKFVNTAEIKYMDDTSGGLMSLAQLLDDINNLLDLEPGFRIREKGRGVADRMLPKHKKPREILSSFDKDGMDRMLDALGNSRKPWSRSTNPNSYRVKDLKSICIILRIRRGGNKWELIGRIERELRKIATRRY